MNPRHAPRFPGLLVALCALAACDPPDSGPIGDTGVAGSSDLSGELANGKVHAIEAAYWIGKPADPDAAAGGPFVYLFGGPVSCNDLSLGAGWLETIDAGTQVFGMIVGATDIGTTIPVGDPAAGGVEINFNIAGMSSEIVANGGGVSLTAYAEGEEVAGYVDALFDEGSASGSFEAVYCPTGLDP